MSSRNIFLCFTVLVFVLLVGSYVNADSLKLQPAEMDHSSHDGSPIFLEKQEIDGYTVSFHVMDASSAMQHGGTHNLMVKIEENGKAVEVAKINSKVIYPAGNSESKMLMKMGDWYMAGYNIVKDGRHQIMILFKTNDGKKHGGGVYYPEK